MLATIAYLQFALVAVLVMGTDIWVDTAPLKELAFLGSTLLLLLATV